MLSPDRVSVRVADALTPLRNELGASGYVVGTLQAFSLGELFGHILTGTRDGTLFIWSDNSRRTVDLRDGQVVFATSSEPFERLGFLLVNRGWLSPQQLDSALSKVQAGVRIGQVLVRAKEISAATLYTAMTELVRDIVLNAFELSDGEFAFLEGLSLYEDALKLPESTRSIVLQGMKRAEEVERLRRNLPPSTRVMPGNGQFPEAMRGFLTRIGEGGELGALRPLFQGSEHAFLSGVQACLASGALVPQQAQPATSESKSKETARSSALQLYASLVQAICRALTAAGQDLSDLQSFLKDPLPGMEEAFAGVQLSAQGELDVEQVIKNLGGGPIQRAKAYEALDSFMSYALFSAKNVIPADSAEALAKECKRIQAGLRQ